MPLEITTIATRTGNSYLIAAGNGFSLVDTGLPFSRRRLERALRRAGCAPGNLAIVIVTHADFDHAGNCAWLQRCYGARIALHPAELTAVETGSMLASRKQQWGLISRASIRVFSLFLYRRFTPDISLRDGESLTPYGLPATVVHLPGHSSGSIGVLTDEGDLFCGDLLYNPGRPARNTLVDDKAEMDASIERLKAMNIRTVYPGHGRPFAWTQFTSPA